MRTFFFWRRNDPLSIAFKATFWGVLAWVAVGIFTSAANALIGGVAAAQQAFAHPQNGMHRIEFYPNATVSEIVLDAATFEPATEQILRAYEVPGRVRVRARSLPELGRACESRE